MMADSDCLPIRFFGAHLTFVEPPFWLNLEGVTNNQNQTFPQEILRRGDLTEIGLMAISARSKTASCDLLYDFARHDFAIPFRVHSFARGRGASSEAGGAGTEAKSLRAKS
jgi:hypothetical protein